MLILGINAFHGDAAACLLRDGGLVAAAEEERFRRVKHWAGFPTEAIRWCLAEARIDVADLDHISVNQDGRAHLGKKLAYVLRNRPDPNFVLERLRNRRARASVGELLAEAFPGKEFRGQAHAVEHHIAHLSSAFHVSPFPEAAVVSIDGFGDFCSAAWGAGDGSDISIDGRVYFPHSLGVFYQAVTQHLGFWNYGDEYKVMGLAPYGKPRFLHEMRRIVFPAADGGYRLDLTFFRHHRDKIAYEWKGGTPTFARLFTQELEELLGPARAADEPLIERHNDIAHSAQAVYEEAFFHLLETIQQRHKLTDLALAGGCAANSVANGKIRRRTPYRRIYVQSAAGDAGGAIGAAFATWHKLGGPRSFIMDHAYWGPHYSPTSVRDLLDEQREKIAAAGCVVEEVGVEDRLFHRSAEAIADGKVVGWFQGRMEWGPRALGNRSIVCDPRRSDMKQILNTKIKKRESFRPFAPSILKEHVSDWFEEDDDVPFMMQVFQIREEKRSLIPAVTHVDGSGRLQTVHRHTNPRYHALIEAFRSLTGVPMVLNTSFNENEPVVCRPEEALDCFLRTKMDVLVLDDLFISRTS